jgi:hypothetical protein
MPFRSGPIAYSRLAVTGDAPDAPDDATFATLGKHQLRPPSVGEPPEILSGFCTGRHVFDAAFTYDACGFGPALLAAMRIDVAKVPGEIKRAYRTMAEDERRAKQADGAAPGLSRADRAAAKADADDRCRRDLAEGRFRSSRLVPFLWDLPSGTLLAPLSGDAKRKELAALFDTAFSLRIESRGAGAAAREELGRRGEETLVIDAVAEGVSSPPAGAESERPQVPWAFAGGDLADFLGNQFLLWLWWKSDVEEGLVDLDDGTTVDFRLEKVLDMECAWGVTGRQSLRGEAVTRLPEAAKALQGGKWPRKVGILLAAHGQEFRATLQGDRLSVSGLVLPEPEEAKGLNPRQILEERVDSTLTFERIHRGLFAKFLVERFGRGWPSRHGAMRDWAARLLSRAVPATSAGVVETKPAIVGAAETADQAR